MAYSLELATPTLCQSLGAISGKSGPPEQGGWAGLCTQNLSLSPQWPASLCCSPQRLAPSCRTHWLRLPRPAPASSPRPTSP